MKKYRVKFTRFVLIIPMISAGLAPVSRAQSLGAAVTVFTSPAGPTFSVDGTNYTQAMSAVWPAGSKHTLSVQSTIQVGPNLISRFTFSNWQTNGIVIPGGGTVIVTADPSQTQYQATFSVEYALTISTFTCGDTPNCTAPGTIYVDGSPYGSGTANYYGAGSNVTLMAVPNSGYVFGGWVPGPNQTIQGAIDTVSLTGPVTVYPTFQVARRVNLSTVPDGLQVLADRTPVNTPITMEWGWNSTHSVGPVSPQMDHQGVYWVFGSWSDSGASTHAYQVAPLNQPDSLTATYVRGAAVAFTTSPPGLKLTIDGRDNWPSYSFLWGIGETHQAAAPARQTDAQGRIYTFSNWSNGGAAAQDIQVPPTAADTGLRFTATYTAMGHLTVNSLAPGLSVAVDGVACATPCDVDRAVGAVVRVSAPGSLAVADGSRQDFNGWPGSGSTGTDWSYTLGADPLTVSLSYHLMNRLAADAAPPEGASWNIQPGSPDGYYDSQAAVTLLVTALPGFRFRNWSGDLSGAKPAGVLMMNAPRSVHAQLDRVPYIAPAGVVNGAGGSCDAGVAPGSVVSIFGQSLAPDTVTGPTSPLAQTLDGVTVRLGDRLLPLFFISPTQINLQLPDDVATGTLLLVVSSQGQPDVQASFNVVRDAPGLFPQVVNNQSFALAFHQDGTPVTTDAPALQGELLTVYGTGFGPADRARPEGFPASGTPVSAIVDAIQVTIGGAAPVTGNAFVAPGRIGIDAVQFSLGADAPSATNAALSVEIGGQNSNSVLLPVK